ncbi:hypothetical protein WOLCODRAFT_144540 [Wolfiporia cocos MD-104 SS10]|uniref:XPG-I domain-containing protein n=1 Tax=Wolfiporia cocos (strain MD-104) TaxID=742152 RepID=A0A2H3JPT8_WOLCO|nr:hypothetical protein WOLCODRAFT_144540 [Wolfiporia cocos MD-104 SS10]
MHVSVTRAFPLSALLCLTLGLCFLRVERELGMPFGLWDILSKAGQSRSLAYLAVVDGFEKNESGRRAYRIGIDASLWYQHAEYSKGGANPEIRTLFFRLRSLAELPLIPLFVFDGRERPKTKRGSRMGKSGSHNMTPTFKKLLDALGEAEAELAYLNQVGVIDAVMTDDVDTLLFGAHTILRNPSLHLTGNRANPARNADGKPSKHHVMVFTADAIQRDPEIGLTRGGLILIALLSGGDYDSGLSGFGMQKAHDLSRLGFGDRLLDLYAQHGRNVVHALGQWRADINEELRTNAHGLLRSSYPYLSIPATFPNIDVLNNYANPKTSAQVGRQGGGVLRDSGDISLPRAAGFCEDYFDEWGHRSAIIKRFRDLMWPAAVMSILRRTALEADDREKTRRIAAGGNDRHTRGPLRPSRADGVGTPASLIKKYLNPSDVDRRAAAFVRSNLLPQHIEAGDPNPVIKNITKTRNHVSTDRMLEYYVDVDPTQLVDLTITGIKGKHREPAGGVSIPTWDDDDEDFIPGNSQTATQKTPKKPPPEPYSILKMWVPASIMRQVHPGLVEDYEQEQAPKQAKKGQRGRRKRLNVDSDDSEGEDEGIMTSSPAKAVRHPGDMPNNDNVDRVAGPSTQRRHLPANVNTPCTGINSTPRIIISPFAQSSLPMRECGFVFTFPDPDDPDQLATDSDYDDVVADPEPPFPLHSDNDNQIRSAQARASAAPSTSPRTKDKGKAPARHGRPRKSVLDAAFTFDEELAEDLEESSPGKYDVFIDRILGIPVAGDKSKAPVRKKRSGPPATSTRTTAAKEVSSSKRRKTAIVGRELAPFPVLPSLEEGYECGLPSPTPALPAQSLSSTFHYLSPLKPTNKRCRAGVGESDVIEIDSDDEDMAFWKTPPRTQRPHYRAFPSSSQNSALSIRASQDPDDIIDLT